MGNKTEMAGAPYRFVFYAVDFDEVRIIVFSENISFWWLYGSCCMQEVSFLSGLTLRKQREFVMNSITAVHKIHKPLGVSKVLFIIPQFVLPENLLIVNF